MSSARKKAIVRKYSRDWVAGYLPPEGFVQAGQVQFLDLAGKVLALDAADIKWICFVRDFQSGEMTNPERLLRKSFAARPRGDGLMVRVRLKDNDILEGIAQNDVTLLTSGGIFLIPPDIRSNTQRIWLPGASVVELEILAVLGKGANRRPRTAAPGAERPAPPEQEQLFG